jgi:plasmid stabilization system protein ParE
MKLGYAPRALRDLEGIATYLGQRSPSGAGNVLSAIQSSIEALTVFPEMAPVVDDTSHRRLPVLTLSLRNLLSHRRGRAIDPSHPSYIAPVD